MHPLDGPRFKIARARSLIEALRSANARFEAEADYRVIVAELNPRTRKYALRALVNVLPPLDLGVCIGEIAHDLRSALDGLVYQLGVLNGAIEETLTRTQFPIFLKGKPVGCQGKCRRAKPHFYCHGRDMIGPLRHVHQQAIERLQPFKKGNLGKKSPLYLLHELNNADKHRLLQVVGAEPVGYLIGGVWGDEPAPDYWMSLGVVFEDGAKVGRVAAADVDKRKVQIEQRITPIIAFWRGCEAVQGRRVTPMLSEIAGHVSRIVGSFAPDFP